jgi:hypothetical protein
MLSAVFGIVVLIFLSHWVGKNAYASGYEKGVHDGAARAILAQRKRPATRLVAPRTPVRPVPTVTDEEIVEFLNRERIKVND